MSCPPIYTTSQYSEKYSEIIDVRSPKEFGEDCIPGAINLPVLNNEERAEVGTIYKQKSPFEARKIGAALVAKNIAYHLSHHFASKDKNYSPLIYCWRGGQRSNSLATVLMQIGWRVTLLEGGYKTYRKSVCEQLETLPSQFTYKILSGMTGTGKTYLLRQLALRGGQVLDLEHLANHRGSLLGQEWNETPEPQPSQKRFESLLVQKLQQFDSTKPVWLESESNKIGKVYLPQNLWIEMKRSRAVQIRIPLAARIEFLLKEYPHLSEYPDFLKGKLLRLKSRHGEKKINQWLDWIERGEWQALVGDLLTHHYDVAYQRSLNRTFQIDRTLAFPDLFPLNVERALEEMEKLSFS